MTNKTSPLTEEKLRNALIDALAKIDFAIPAFANTFPSAASTNGIYTESGNNDWTQCFWTGMLWLAFEFTKEKKYLDVASGLMKSFINRIDNRIALEDHDIGFIFILSTLAGYKVTGDKHLREKSLDAAKVLADRFREKGQFIQLCGEADCKDASWYRLIIDTLMNINLLYWAGVESGDSEYTRKAFAHFNTTMDTVVRPDGSTFQNFFFDQKTGARLRAGNRQGLNDSTCWSRGQAWGIAGGAFTYSYMKNDEIMEKYCSIVDYFLDHLPEDNVAYWDLCFTEGGEPRDSSAAAIAVCGLLEACKIMPLSEMRRKHYETAAENIMNSLIDNYTTKDDPQSNGLLKHATYYYAGNLGVDECNIWGDYFYMEAIMRFLNPDWKKYW